MEEESRFEEAKILVDAIEELPSEQKTSANDLRAAAEKSRRGENLAQYSEFEEEYILLKSDVPIMEIQPKPNIPKSNRKINDVRREDSQHVLDGLGSGTKSADILEKSSFYRQIEEEKQLKKKLEEE